jgi:hypothetical protein
MNRVAASVRPAARRSGTKSTGEHVASLTCSAGQDARLYGRPEARRYSSGAPGLAGRYSREF